MVIIATVMTMSKEPTDLHSDISGGRLRHVRVRRAIFSFMMMMMIVTMTVMMTGQAGNPLSR